VTIQLCQKCGTAPATQGIYDLMVCDSCAEVLLEPIEPSKLLAKQEEIIKSIVAKDSRFSGEVYEFVAEAMGRAFHEWGSKHREMPVGELAEMKMRGEQLVGALRRLASERFGKCAAATFNLWGVTRWQDFAEIVSRMQEAKLLPFGFLAFNKEDFKSRGVLDDVFPER
jgi:uncharacterized repeat protein (TIGR04138 family)